ncbi:MULTISPECIES: response regulator transcription factor [unclassified Mesorhizobium]|uniref:response regulator n=1 Tax=unclassified Mesorhizobium TaxID=325217 RepID=UPI000FDB753B|nr:MULTISPECIES: response regulator transcription factor [unclassified Mesorhizobium]TGQ31072.1 response regulator transcription factor [Mesorhizobium sp. M00.F.Ca.ET.216.01.1.1]TIS55731.1 MAG: response regulator [Mesorhizobium sp.]TIS86820.1 MAG: response regulator [Mesorhizobium sp.]TJW04605.1 MAG: response regulator [Mesorhizobium sp.]TJW47928.1 MAG: response regulator [Mesorhizobium sp.]
MNKISRVALIADDDEFFRIALRTILATELEFSVVIETASLDDAIEQLSERSDISLALFDLAMPGMESPASLKAVRDFHNEMKIAVVSASASRFDILSALEAGVHGYVPKGLGAAELTAALRLIIAGVIYVPPAIADRTMLSDEPVTAQASAARLQKPVIDALTPRQRNVLELIVEGHSNKQIARKLGLGEGTIKIHLAALFRNLGVRNRAAAAVAGSRMMSGDGHGANPN